MIILGVLIVIVVIVNQCSLDESIPMNNYDWSNLRTNGEVKTYTAANGETSKFGIDVSYHNGTIDWSTVASEGVEFAFVRVGWRGYDQGQISEDPMADTNISQAMSNGIDVGLYFFSQAITEDEAREEADFICDFADLYGITDFPIVFDMESIDNTASRIDSLTTEERTQIALAFCARVEERGYTPMIYGNDAWLNGKFDLQQISKYSLWLSQYNEQPSASYAFGIWQYSCTGTINGIDTDVDLDLMFPSG